MNLGTNSTFRDQANASRLLPLPKCFSVDLLLKQVSLKESSPAELMLLILHWFVQTKYQRSLVFFYALHCCKFNSGKNFIPRACNVCISKTVTHWTCCIQAGIEWAQ